jgi:hypothetical protein
MAIAVMMMITAVGVVATSNLVHADKNKIYCSNTFV